MRIGALIIIVVFTLSVAAQRATVTSKSVRDSLYGKSVSALQWRFESDELIEVEVISSQRVGRETHVVVYIRTGNAPGVISLINGRQMATRVEGKIKLAYSNGYLARVENIDATSIAKAVDIRAVNSAPPLIVAGNAGSPLINQTFHVSAGGWYNFPFTVNRKSRITGTFVAEGGGRSNIQGLIMSQREYLNWKNSNENLAYYRSKPVTVGEVDIVLDPGQYVMVFYNPDWLNAKTVAATIYAR